MYLSTQLMSTQHHNKLLLERMHRLKQNNSVVNKPLSPQYVAPQSLQRPKSVSKIKRQKTPKKKLKRPKSTIPTQASSPHLRGEF